LLDSLLQEMLWRTICRGLSVTNMSVTSFTRCMASRRRDGYIQGGSNKQDISQEAKDLIQKARDPDDLSWQEGPGVEKPTELDLRTTERDRALQYLVSYKGYDTKVDNGVEGIKYWPHTGDNVDPEPASPVLMVTRIKRLFGEPYWNKNYCRQIGIGYNENINKRVFLPNLPSVGLLLYRIKHLIKITPITFPQGMPEDFSPDTHGFKLTSQGEFIVTPTKDESVESIAQRAEWMKITRDDVAKEGRRHWDAPFNSPLGNSNYHRDTTWIDKKKADSEYVKNKASRRKWS